MADSDPPRPQRSDSQATNASLLQLDPSPIESPSTEKRRLLEDDEDLDSSTSAIRTGSTSAPGLSGSGYGSIYYLTRIQEYSSYAINLFATLHLANVSLIPAATGSADASETYLLMTRELYQTSIMEPLLVALPVAAHVGSGVVLRFLRRQQNAKRYGSGRSSDGSRKSSWPSLSYISLSGYGLLVFYGAHVFTNRILPLMVEGDSSDIGLAYVAHGFARNPISASVAYVGLIAAAAGHMVWGSAKWLGAAPSTRGWLQPRKGGDASVAVVDKETRKQRRRKWMGVHGVAVGVAALWAVGGLGVVGRAGASSGWVGKLYDEVFARGGM